MFDRPSGLVENKLPDGFNRNNFSLYDSADEEVQFSRYSIHPQADAYPTQAAFYKQVHQESSDDQDLSGQLNGFADVKIDADGKLYPDRLNHEPHNAKFEQARSSRLLTSIGTKLRRGSNFLAAPTVVGSYLLGITIQSWVEFFDTSRMLKAPSNTHQLTRRLISNLAYFRGNYLCVAFILIVYCILTSPLLLLAIIAYLIALYFVTVRSASGRPLQVAGFRPNLQQQYYSITLVSIPLLWVAGAPSAVFWVIGASFVVVGLHASMHNIDQIPDNIQVQSSSMKDVQLVSLSNFVPAVQYYNHYQSNHYLPLATPEPHSQWNNSAGKQTNWTLFGYLSRQPKRGLEDSSSTNKVAQKVPEVKIISHDFAGLGRVYEI